jgi:hypothetical protein
MASMPGYELTEPWLTEDGLPKKGIWDVVYFAGGGKGLNGCKPMPKLRRSLLQLVSAFLRVCIVSFGERAAMKVVCKMLFWSGAWTRAVK